jgi:peptide/nickel transport system ATP-binding protein
MKNNHILEIKGLSAAFENKGERKEVLHDISFQISSGHTLGIVGESGSGKSVTSLSIMRLIPSPPIDYDAGSIVFGQEEINLIAVAPADMRRLRGSEIAMIFQEPMTSLNPLKKCGEQVSEVFQEHTSLERKTIKEEVLSLFEKVKLPDPIRIFESYPHQLSGGQKQRVMIAMAISCKPKLLIADEPTTALDVTVQREILELIKELQKETNMAMIFISHDLGVVAQIADEILVMHQGHIVESGIANQVMNSPQHPYTKGLLSSRPPIDKRPVKLLTVEDNLRDKPSAMTLESKSSRDSKHLKLYKQEALISVEDVHTWYPIRSGIFNKVTGYVKAVKGASLKLFPGETLGIVGESGCGKSSLGRSILGLEQIQSGTIRYKGKTQNEMTTLEQKEMLREVQMIFQDPYSSLNPRMSVGEAILEPMTVHSILENRTARKEEVMRLLDKVGLEPSAFDRAPHEFSGGQRQRICIARTLALRPKVVICDESVSALDVSVQAQVLNLLNDLKQDYGLSYIFISHDLSVVRYMSDKVIVMQAGEVLEYEEADKLYANPSTAYTQSLIASAYN